MAGDFTPRPCCSTAHHHGRPDMEEVWRPVNSGGGFAAPCVSARGAGRITQPYFDPPAQGAGHQARESNRTALRFHARAVYARQQSHASRELRRHAAGDRKRFRGIANGGYRVEPFYIDRSKARRTDRLLRRAETVCAECGQPIRVFRTRNARRIRRSAPHPAAVGIAAGARRTLPAERTITPQVAFLMNDI